jgi:putative ABC transport system permease protein
MANRVLCVGLLAVLMASGTTVSTSEPAPLLVSRQLAARAHLAIGETVTLAVDAHGARATTFRVVGIYEPTPDPMRFTAARIEARVHLPELIAMTAEPGDPGAAEMVTAINVKLRDPEDVGDVRDDIRGRMPGVVAFPTARPSEGDPFAVLERFHVAISIITVLGGTAFLLALMVIRAEERRETIGLLRLLGVSRRSLLTAVVVEGLIVAVLGAIVGIAIAVAGQGIVNRIFQLRYDTALVFVRVTPSIALRSVAFAVPLGVLAGFAASWTVLRRDVLSLFRR